MPDYRLFAVIYSLIIVQERFITISRLALDDGSCNLWCRFKVTARTVPAQLRTMPFGPNFFASLYWEPVPSNRRTPLSAPASKRCLNLLDSGETTMMMRKFLSLVLVLSFCGVAIAADTLTLKDGTAHTGTVISVTSRTVTFKEAGTLHKYPRSSVESLQFGGSHAASTSKEAT